MALPLSKTCIPVWLQLLGSLDAMLDNAAAHATAKKINPDALLQARLYPDMFPLLKQVQLVSDFAKGPATRLAGIEPPKWADDEKTFDDLKNRISRTVHLLHGIDLAAIDAGETRDIYFNVGPMAKVMKGTDYLQHFALPNFYFHHVTSYAILRHNGVEVGKRDFMGNIPGF